VDGRHQFGLSFMRERAEQLGGSVRIESAPDTGTCVLVEIPLKMGATA
jgi:signal transduction histidine kinase